MSTDGSLVVPVVCDADKKNFAEIEREMLHLAIKARENKLSSKDLQGSTFTITNGGVFSSLMSTPILNGPQVGILGMHKIQLHPVAIDEVRMENCLMMYVTLSYDHLIIDGKEAVGFLVKVKELLEDPKQLFYWNYEGELPHDFLFIPSNASHEHGMMETIGGFAADLFAGMVVEDLVDDVIEKALDFEEKEEFAEGMIVQDEVCGVNKVLNEAALTYVTAVLISVLE